MPIYTFKCDKKDGGCGHRFEIVMSMKKYTINHLCPKCKSDKVTRDYQSDQLTSFVKLDDDQLKLGHLAKRNTERMSNDERVHLDYKNNEYKYNKKGGELPSGMKHIKSPKYKKEGT